MTQNKLYSSILLPFSLALTLAGCGAEGGGSDELTLANPIADITLTGDTKLDFTIPENTCTSTSIHTIKYQIDNVTDSSDVDFSLNNLSTTLTGYADNVGDVTVSISCSVLGGETLTDEFTITVVDFEADPVVTISTDSVNEVRGGTEVTLTAEAEVPNLTGEIDPNSYVWEQISGTAVILSAVDADGTIMTFEVPEIISVPEELVFEVTVADASDSSVTTTSSITINAIPKYAPKVAISFPLSLGEYSSNEVDFFGTVEAATGGNLNSVTVYVDDIDHLADVSNGVWRVANLSLPSSAEIKVAATDVNGHKNYAELSFNKDTFYATGIDNDISDIAVDEINGYVYAQVDGVGSSQTEFIKFDLSSAESSELDIDQTASFLNDEPTSITIDSESQTLFVGYATGASKINLSTNKETRLYDVPNYMGTDGKYYSGFITDLFYDDRSEELYSAEWGNAILVAVDPDSGNRRETGITGSLGAIAVNSNGNLYLSGFNGEPSEPVIFESVSGLTAIYSDTNSGNTEMRIYDIAVNEDNNLLYFVNSLGHLIELNLLDSSNNTTISLSDLFSTKTLINTSTPLVGLHYDNTRKLLIAAGRDSNGTDNKLLVIDPETWNYATIAEGSGS